MIKEISAAEKGKGLGQTPSSKGLGGGNSRDAAACPAAQPCSLAPLCTVLELRYFTLFAELPNPLCRKFSFSLTVLNMQISRFPAPTPTSPPISQTLQPAAVAAVLRVLQLLRH